VCLQVLLGLLDSWAYAGVITTPPPAVDEDPVSNTRSAGEPVNFNHVGGMHMPGFVPMPGFAPLIHGGPSVYGAQQQLGPGANGGYGAQQPVHFAFGGQTLQGGPAVYGAQQLGPGAYGGYGAHQPVDGAIGGQYMQGGQRDDVQPPISEDQPDYSGTAGYGNPGYGYGPMSTPQICLPYGGFGPVEGPGRYYGGPYGGFSGQMRKLGRYGSLWKKSGKYGGFGEKYGFYPFSDYEDMFDQNADDYLADLYGYNHLADLYGADQEDDEHFKSASARLEKYLQRQWQLGKRKLQVQVDYGNIPLEWEFLNQYHNIHSPLFGTRFAPKYGLPEPPAPIVDHGYGAGFGHGQLGTSLIPGYNPHLGYGPHFGLQQPQPSPRQDQQPPQAQPTST